MIPDQIITSRTIIRLTTPEDLKAIYNWPSYPVPFTEYNMKNPLWKGKDGRYWWEQIDVPERVHYSVLLPETKEVIGLHAFVDIDRDKRIINNMGIRFRPDLCDKGFCTETLSVLFASVLDSGIQSIKLDVSAINPRAINCYKKCGMNIIGDFWIKHDGDPVDLKDPFWTPHLQHLKQEKDYWLRRHYLMEITKKHSDLS
ncbi:MAG: hypothetical protein A2231_06355 [Candidatus Firestonebacteria bacterium RIFOXYA2_FULL_40_8]|nr:MAG: hypothetical protein A2231_06355 [Candidatus Firestonebacteria bacterium RIFOXYA2_FULL_40_8]